MSSQPRFSLVTPAQVRGALKATASTDLDVLAAARDQFAAPYRPLKWFGIWAIVTGTLCTALILLAFIGIPLIIFGVWAIRRAKRNAATIEAACAEYLTSLGERAPAKGGGPAGMGAVAMGILVALLGTAPAHAQNKEVDTAYRGDYVPATSACTSALRLRLGADRMTLVNGRDSAVFRDLDFTWSYFGRDYQGVQFVSMPEYTRSSTAPEGAPFLVTFNADEKKGMLSIMDMQAPLKRRFPIADTPLKRCDGGATFEANITDVRTSVSGSDRLVTVTLRVRNRTSGPLTLAYVQQSGIITDDRGNRYVVYGAGSVRGLGEISGNSVDPKFTLPAGESADARLEFVWRATRGAIYGTAYNLDVALRELQPLPGGQWQLGREHALQYRGLTPSGAQAASNAPAPTAAAAKQPAAGAPPASASCGDRPQCVASGPLMAEVVRVVPSVAGRHHVLQISMRVSNASDSPLYLGYTSGSSGAVDDLGNRYYFGRAGTHDVSFRGIGLVTERAADPQFRVDPGASRTAMFSVTRFEGARQQQGTSWTWDLALEELEILPSRQVRAVRQHALSFPDLRAGALAADPAAAAQDLIKGVKKLLDRKKPPVG